MKKSIVFGLSIAFIFAATTIQAQKLKLESGSFAPANAVKEFNIVYNYDNMTVGTGKKAKPEAAYLAEKVAEFNAKEPGRGDKWATQWVADREAQFQVKFEQLLAKGGIKKNPDAKYTLVVHTTMTEPGWSVPMVATVPSAINATITLVETAAMDKEIGKMSITGSPGNAFSGAAWDTGNRIQESYAKAAKEFAKWLPKAK